MRVFLLILSLLILFQPASWAMGMPMITHQQMDHVSTHSIILTTATIEGHCQTINTNTVQASAFADSNDQPGNYMLAGCLATGSSAASFTNVVGFSFELQHLDVVYFTPKISFHSHTESPEIRPPLSIRFQG